ncbi:hypothetical protein LTSESEN_0377 [Salmonella enterica subsp. enterica serovar Senftenberg str. A4-543]|uniref:Uncharacterized protein n=1 Tax=Salmonella enterica subsp. enterica serovar Senftenberg str. A4-543 TaxID=913082 RepID=G5QUU5_SALSE|nr:hypothetical protein LTSESEN_0377 [Salmonella enterica subsp. enterica serovar Senftenberg str. A4-543]
MLSARPRAAALFHRSQRLCRWFVRNCRRSWGIKLKISPA